MNRADALRQATTVAELLRTLLRHLTAGEDDPVVELPLAQLRLCSALGGGPRPMSALSRELGVSLSAITQLADRLERARLIKRIAGGDDRRVRRLRLTPRGAEMMRRHEETRVRRTAAMLARLSSKTRDKVAPVLQRLVRAAASSRGCDGNGARHVGLPRTKVLL